MMIHRKSGAHINIPTLGMKMGQPAIKSGCKEKRMDSRSLALEITYRICRKKFDLLWIWEIFGSMIRLLIRAVIHGPSAHPQIMKRS
jgi:hypothetical protein